jgi:Bacterial membrane protein YfhO
VLAGVAFVAVALTFVFWAPLWNGGGLVGGDIYAYFLPQKAFYAEQLQAGSLPLWNNRIGWGYPQMAESQTGVFYPLHLPLYRFLDLNAAFNASIIAHYVLAFLFTWMYARQTGLSPIGGTLAAVVFVYGWFPPRVCLEWAILGGTWMPLALWCAERFVQTRFWRYAVTLALVLAVQMLAGHFLLAFVTQLVIVAYVPLRARFAARDVDQPIHVPRTCGAIALAIVTGFLLAAVQLIPTWELKQHSQRLTVTAEHDPAYGSIPPAYLTQFLAPWYWYADEQHFSDVMFKNGPRTNRVEAHLYFGMLPLALAAWAVWKTRGQPDRRMLIWIVLGLAALVHSSGVLMPVLKYVPGFSFFEGPGRFGIVTTLACALWAGCGLELLIRPLPLQTRRLAVAVILAVTLGDLWLVSRVVTYAVPVRQPSISRLAQSPLRDQLQSIEGPVRLFSDAKNLPSLLGVSTLPVYLGLGPSQYFDPELMLPGNSKLWGLPEPAQIEWMRRAGVTHLLSFLPLDSRAWPVQRVWQAGDPFLNLSLARHPDEALFLVALSRTRGRIAWEDPETGAEPILVEYQPQRVVVETNADRGGRLILTDLAFPGWQITVDGQPAPSTTTERVFRCVDLTAGKHVIVWTYRPTSLYWGIIVSGSVLLLLLAISHVRYWHPGWFEKVFGKGYSHGTAGL